MISTTLAEGFMIEIMNKQPEEFKPIFHIASKLAAIKASQPDNRTNIDLSKITIPHYLIEGYEAFAGYSKKVTQNLSQPMTVLLTTLETGASGAGIDAETSQLLFEQVLQMRSELKKFSEAASRIHSRF